MSNSYKTIVVTAGPLTGSSFIIGERLTIGRSPNSSVQLIGNKVSRAHAEIRVDDAGHVILSDLGSKNGTYVAGERIQEVALQEDDHFEIGNSSFRLSVCAEPPYDDENTKLSLLSGPVEDETYVLDSPVEPRNPTHTTMLPDMNATCVDPLHEQALQAGWRFCPACGQSV